MNFNYVEGSRLESKMPELFASQRMLTESYT